jgi:DNA-directed RNA polymerase specialized sigma24 family protein
MTPAPAVRTVAGMADPDAVDRLPDAYRDALALEASGAAAGEIAAQTGVDVDAVPSLVRLAHAKLDALLARDDDREIE